MNTAYNRSMLELLLKEKTHYPYRRGVIRAAYSFGVITDLEANDLEKQVIRKTKEPKLPIRKAKA